MNTISCFACKTETVVSEIGEFGDLAKETGYSYAWAMKNGLLAGFACPSCVKRVRKAMRILESILGPDFEIGRHDDEMQPGTTVIWQDNDNISFRLNESLMIKAPDNLKNS